MAKRATAKAGKKTRSAGSKRGRAGKSTRGSKRAAKKRTAPRRKKEYDCIKCGACCTNPNVNRENGYRNYIELHPRERLMRRPHLKASMTFLDEEKKPHMKMPRHRCIALTGPLGRKALCTIYELRPLACRNFEPGSRDCKKYRKERGIDP